MEKQENQISFWTSRIMLYVILVLFGAVMIFPLVYMGIASLKTSSDFVSNPRRLLPYTQETSEYNGQSARLYEFEIDGEMKTYIETIISADRNEVNKIKFGYFATVDDFEASLDNYSHDDARQAQYYVPSLEVPLVGLDEFGNEVDITDGPLTFILERQDQQIERGTRFEGESAFRTYDQYLLSYDPNVLPFSALEFNAPPQPLNYELEINEELEGTEEEPISNIGLVAYSETDYASSGETLILTNMVEEREFVDTNGDTREYDVYQVTYGDTTEELLLITNPRIAIFLNQSDSENPVIALADDNRRAEHIEFQFENYNVLLELEKFDRALVNTIFVTILVVLGQLVTSVMGGYAFSRIKFRGRDTIFLLYLGSIMIPFVVLIVPMYRLMVVIGWQAKIVSLIVPWVFTAYGTFLMRQFFITIPKEIEEAALLDGCSRFRILWQIFIPLSTPAIAAQAIFTFLYAWNSFLWPLFMFSDKPSDSRVLTLALISLANRASGGDPNLVFTGAAVTILPPIIVFILAQKYFVEGIATSGLKG